MKTAHKIAMVICAMITGGYYQNILREVLVPQQTSTERVFMIEKYVHYNSENCNRESYGTMIFKETEKDRGNCILKDGTMLCHTQGTSDWFGVPGRENFEMEEVTPKTEKECHEVFDGH